MRKRIDPDRLGAGVADDHQYDRFARCVLAERFVRRPELLDAFDVKPYNDPEGYTNRDQGHAWTAGYLFNWSERLRLGVEYLTIATEHCDTDQCAWVFSGLPRTTHQNQVQLSLRWQFHKRL